MWPSTSPPRRWDRGVRGKPSPAGGGHSRVSGFSQRYTPGSGLVKTALLGLAKKCATKDDRGTNADAGQEYGDDGPGVDPRVQAEVRARALERVPMRRDPIASSTAPTGGRRASAASRAKPPCRWRIPKRDGCTGRWNPADALLRVRPLRQRTRGGQGRGAALRSRVAVGNGSAMWRSPTAMTSPAWRSQSAVPPRPQTDPSLEISTAATRHGGFTRQAHAKRALPTGLPTRDGGGSGAVT